jgi:hypothetical protein
MWGNWWDPARGTGILPVAIGPDTGWKPVPHPMPHMSLQGMLVEGRQERDECEMQEWKG